METDVKRERSVMVPFALRMKESLRDAAARAAREEDRSINWVLNDRLERAFGLKEAA